MERHAYNKSPRKFVKGIGMIISLEPQPFEVTVPSDATQVEMWFHNYTTLGHGCEAWDSRYCQNYWYSVEK